MNKDNYELGSTKNQHAPKGGPNQMGGEKAKDLKKSLKSVFLYSKKYKPMIIISLICAVVSSILTLIGPNQLSKITDAITAGLVTNNIDMSYIFNIGLFLAIIYMCSFIFSLIQGILMGTAMQNTASNLRSDICKKINNLPMGYFAKNTKGDILSRVTNDSDTIGQTFSQSAATLMSASTLLIGSAIMMFVTNWILAITAVVSTILGFILMRIIMKKSQTYFSSQQKYLGKINGHIEEMYAGHTVLKAYNGEKKAIEIFDDVNKNLKTSARRAQTLSGLMMPIMIFVGNFGYVCVCIVGSLLAFEGIISFGTIVAFMVYIRLFTQPMSQIAQGIQNIQSGSAAAERVFEFLDEEEMKSDDEIEVEKVESDNEIEIESDDSNMKKDITTEGNVIFENVVFGYDPDKIIIKDFSANIKKGQKIAIVGPTGAGKTTIVNLLMRFYEINSGKIFIDGVDISTIPRKQVHGMFSMVLQDTWILDGTLRENLIYTTKNISEDQLNQACEAVGLHHFVKTLANGYDTILDESLQLSSGQKQQITIARAIISNKPMIILDEATSSIDTRTETIIQKAMDNLMMNRTSFIIAHRLSTIRNADLILVLKDGDIIEKGNHTELLSQNGFYAELYNSQFDNKE